MKPILTLLICSTLMIACKKEITQTNGNEYLKNVKVALKASMTGLDYSNLDFSKAILNRVDSVSLYFVRVPFKGKSIASDFVLLKTENNGSLKEGKIIHLEGSVKQSAYDGNVSINSLDRASVLSSAIHKGYIEAFHNNWIARKQVMEANVMPEVVIVTYVNRTSDYSTWLWLNSFFYINSYTEGGGSDGGSNGGGYYGSIGGGSGGYDSGGYGGSGSGDYSGGGDVSTVDPTILIDVDTYVNQPAIDVEQFLKCFENIPDAGAQCEVGIYADIPVDSDPNKIFDFSTGSPGHTFIQIKKVSADGTESVVQNIGFYPITGWKNGITNAPIDAKFVDDSQHEFNAGFTKSLTPEEFKSALTEILYLKNMQYDIDNYNCTDWALAIFNKQGYGLDIPLYDIPGNLPSTGTSLPQGVYNKLLEMKKNNDVHADKIQIGFYKGFVTSSDGPCY